MDQIQVIERTFQVLDVIASAPNDPHTISELAGKTGLKVSTVSRIVRTLAVLGHLESGGRKTGYVMGRRFVNLTHLYRDTNPLRTAAEPYLKAFREEFGEYICVSHLTGGKRHIAAFELSTHTVQISGRLYPEIENPYRSVSGRILLSGLSPADRERCYHINGIPGKLWEKIRSEDEFIRELDRIAGLEYLSEIEDEIAMLAFPVRKDGSVSAAVGVFLPEYRFQGKRREDLLNAIRKIVSGIEKSVIF